MLAAGLSSLPCGAFHKAAWCLCNMTSAFLYGEWDAIYYNLASKATLHHFWNILLVTQASPIQCGRTLYSIQECKYKKAGTIEGYLGGWLWHSDLALNGSYPSHIQNTLTPPQGSPKSHSITVSNWSPQSYPFDLNSWTQEKNYLPPTQWWDRHRITAVDIPIL